MREVGRGRGSGKTSWYILNYFKDARCVLCCYIITPPMQSVPDFSHAIYTVSWPNSGYEVMDMARAKFCP